MATGDEFQNISAVDLPKLKQFIFEIYRVGKLKLVGLWFS
jgi:hypothetical protein